MDLVRGWLNQVKEAVNNKDKLKLSALVNPNLISFNQLRQSLRASPDSQPQSQSPANPIPRVEQYYPTRTILYFPDEELLPGIHPARRLPRRLSALREGRRSRIEPNRSSSDRLSTDRGCLPVRCTPKVSSLEPAVS